MDIDKIRSETPGCEGMVHLNNAGAALMPAAVVGAIAHYLNIETKFGGYEAQDARRNAIGLAYQSVGRIIGAGVKNIAFMENATIAFMQAVSAIPFERNDTILTTCNDYASNQIQFLSLQKRLGVQVIRAPDQAQGGVDVAAMSDLIDKHKPKLVCVTHVPTNSGLEQDVQAIGGLCRDADTIYLVDACQSVGQMPIDVVDMGCDFLSATSRKFLRGPRGSGFLYVSDRLLEQGLEPLFIDMRGANWTGPDSYQAIDSAKRFETWEFAWAQVLGTAAAAAYASDVGLESIRLRVQALVHRLREGLSRIDKLNVLGGDTEVSGIVTLTFDKLDPFKVVTALRGQGVNTSAQGREYAVIDYDRKNVAGALRLSPHYYNTEIEIDQAVSTIRRIVR